MPSKQVLAYIEKAIRKRATETYPNTQGSVIEDVVTATMKYNGWSKETLYLAIELAIKDQAIPKGYRLVEDTNATPT